MRRWLFCALVLAGCEGSPEKGEAQKKPVWEDVPAYGTLEYVDGLAHRNPEFRSGWQEFRGAGGVEPAAKFYRETLPIHGWILSSDEGKDPVKVTFTKKSERCTVEIGTDRDRKLVVRTTLGYKD